MCLIQLLEDEQIALVRYAAATNPSAIDRYGRLIEGIGAEVGMVFPLGSHLADVRRLVEKAVDGLPTHADYVARNCGAG